MPISQNGPREGHLGGENDRGGRFRDRKWFATGPGRPKTRKKLRNTRKLARNQPKTRGGIARGPMSEVGGPKRSICVNLRLFAVVFGLEEACGGKKCQKMARNGLGRSENGNFSRKTGKIHENRKGWGLILFSCVLPVFLLSRGFGGSGRALGGSGEACGGNKSPKKCIANGLGRAKKGIFS